jgi:hypothetical protein
VGDVDGTVTVPTFSAVCTHASKHSIWVGIGGSGSTSAGLFQTGIDTSASVANAVYAFFETYPYESEQSLGLPISPGDSVYMHASYNPTGGVAAYHLIDNTTGQDQSMAEYAMYPYWDGSTAEWIDERPSNASLQYPVDGEYYYYRKSTATTWIGQTAKHNHAGYYPDDAESMVRPNGTTLATATITSDTHSSDSWVACS